MAGGATIGALRFVLGADTAEFERALKGAETGLKRAAAVGTAVGNVIAQVLVRAFDSLARSVAASIEQADKLGEMSEKIGISVERLSLLQHAAQLGGSSIEALSEGVIKLSRAMSDAASNSASRLANTFRTIGVSVTDAQGNLRDIDAVLLELADRFKSWTDGAGKAAIATTLFGEAGANLIPFLNQGASGINALTEEARRLGLTISSDTAQRAAAFNDTMDKLKASMESFIRQVLVPLLPQIQLAAEMFSRWTQESLALKLAVSALDIFFKAFLGVIATVNSLIQDAIIWIGALLNAVKALANFSWSEFTAAFRDAMEQSRRNGEQLSETLRRIRGELSDISTGFGKMGVAAGTVAPPVIASTQAISEAMRRARDEARAALDAIVNVPTETFVAKMAAIEAAYQRGTINARTYGQMVRRVEEENRNNILSTASLLASTLTTVFAKNKAAAIAAAIINTGVAITRAMQLPWPFNWAQAALVAATGAAQIATIKSTNVNGGGGAPSVRGGGGGEDQSSAPAQTLIVQGINPNQIFTGQNMRDFAQQLLDFQKDGGVVVLK